MLFNITDGPVPAVSILIINACNLCHGMLQIISAEKNRPSPCADKKRLPHNQASDHTLSHGHLTTQLPVVCADGVSASSGPVSPIASFSRCQDKAQPSPAPFLWVRVVAPGAAPFFAGSSAHLSLFFSGHMLFVPHRFGTGTYACKVLRMF